MTQPFVAAEFKVPEQLETPEFRLRMLTVHDVVKDYDAVMSSVEHLSKVWPGSGWPEGLTLEQNLIDLGWHQKEFQRRRSFAYTVVNLAETQVLGCVYINPTPQARPRRRRLLLGAAERARQGARCAAVGRGSQLDREGVAIRECGLPRPRHRVGRLASDPGREAIIDRID